MIVLRIQAVLVSLTVLLGCVGSPEIKSQEDLESSPKIAVVELLGVNPSTIEFSVRSMFRGHLPKQFSLNAIYQNSLEGARYYLLSEAVTLAGSQKETLLIPLYDIGRDRFISLKEFVKVNNIDFYTEKFDSSVLWLPVSCKEDDLTQCRSEIALFPKLD